jgi:hypothetical protein
MARDRRSAIVAHPEQGSEWGDWLGEFTWDWFVTLTFPDVIHPEQAAKRHARWTRALEKYERRRVRQARALEYQKRGVIHYHALLWGVRPDTRRLDWMDAWHAIAEGHARIVQYDPALGAAHYLAKYVTKGGEIDLLGPWWRGRGRDDHARPTWPGGGDDAGRERE